MPKRPTLALIAHDGRKADLVAWATFNRGRLAEFELVATATTGALLRDKVGLNVRAVLSGPLGGDAHVEEQERAVRRIGRARQRFPGGPVAVHGLSRQAQLNVRAAEVGQQLCAQIPALQTCGVEAVQALLLRGGHADGEEGQEEAHR